MFKRHLFPFWLALALLAPSRALAQFPDFGDAIQVQILRENIQQTIQLTDELAQLRSLMSNAREQLSLARSIYGGVQDIIEGDPKTFLNEARQYFLSQNPEFEEARYLGEDIYRNGIRGRFDAAPVNRQIAHLQACLCDATKENPDARARASCLAQKREYGCELPSDATAAAPGSTTPPPPSTPSSAPAPPSTYPPDGASVGPDVDALARLLAAQSAASSKLPNDLFQPSASSTTSDLITLEMARTDPRMAAVFVQNRARTYTGSRLAMEQYAMSLGASPGQAQIIAARATALSAQQLTAIADTSGRGVALAELEYAGRAKAAAANRTEVDSLWKALSTDAGSFSRQPLPDAPSLKDR